MWKHSQASGSELLLLLALADMANDEGECWPSVKTLAERCRCSDRTIQRSLSELSELGELEIITRNRGNGSLTSNCYRVRGGDRAVTSPGDTHVTIPLNYSSPPLVTQVSPPEPFLIEPSLESSSSPKEKKSDDSVDEGFISELKNKTAYAFLDLDVEIAKMKGWLQNHPGRKFSRQFVLNWLKKERDSMLAKPERLRPRDGLGRPLGWSHDHIKL